MNTYFPPSLSQNAVTSDNKSHAENWKKTSSQLSNTCSVLGFEDRVREFFFVPPRMRKVLARFIRNDLSNPNPITSDQQDVIDKILRCASGIKAQDRISVTADLISLCNFSPLAIVNAILKKIAEEEPDTDQLLALLKVIARLVVNDGDEQNLPLFKWLTSSDNFLVRECVCEAAANIEDDDASTLILRILSEDNDERIRNMANDYLEEA